MASKFGIHGRGRRGGEDFYNNYLCGISSTGWRRIFTGVREKGWEKNLTQQIIW